MFDSVADAVFLSPEEINAHTVRDADALFVRTRTKINKELLAESNVRFVATATIGYDHIDVAYCREAGITWVSCPGCNAQAVCDYVEEAICSIKKSETVLTVGVVGFGHVGKLVVAMAEKKGWRVLVSDPPLGVGVSLNEMVPQCDVVTFHTPLTLAGEYPTYHMCNAEVLSLCKDNTLLINAARGGVVEEHALIEKLTGGNGKVNIVIDCWENEPQVNLSLLQRADLATFHIAGYSLEGKMNASEMCLRAFCEFFSLPILSINKKVVPLQGDSEAGWLKRISDQLKAAPEHFEQLRKQYKLR
ncbi:MAG: 4-phosphoerythronate dehydrogenase [Paludibacteraceae bacterium]|nr:4-phosphoerythronate dehydrogenase [Paludibacteraceae bacterium]